MSLLLARLLHFLYRTTARDATGCPLLPGCDISRMRPAEHRSREVTLSYVQLSGGSGMARLMIGELAARSGAAPSALRFYESKGLLSSERTSGGQRVYDRSTLRRVAFIRAAQRVGLTLEEIGKALDTLPSRRTPTAADWARLSASWRSKLDQRIAELQRLRDELDNCIGCG